MDLFEEKNPVFSLSILVLDTWQYQQKCTHDSSASEVIKSQNKAIQKAALLCQDCNL